MSKDYTTINQAFESAVEQLQKDLEYSATRPRVNQGYLDKQNKVLERLIAFQNYTQYYIRSLETENAILRTKHKAALLSYQERIIAFEAICIIHGIIDFPMWLSFGRTLLEDKAIRLNTDNKIELSYTFKQKLKTLPKADRILVETILFRDTDNAIQTLLAKLNQGYTIQPL